jgi:uncharacterized protein (TIGR02996 family)
MRSFVHSKGKTHRFWNAVLDGYDLMVSSGTSGPGEVECRHFKSPDEARKEHDRLVAERLAEGFVETTDQPLCGPFDSPTRRALEDALAEDPDDLAAHHAYADLLVELGDPRGEFIQIQLALEDESLAPTQRASLRRREKALLKKHERTWLGPMAGYWIDKMDAGIFDLNSERPHGLAWRRGWIDSLTFGDGAQLSGRAAVRRRDLLRCLRSLSLEYSDEDNDSGYSDLLEADCFANVRYFQVGDLSPGACFFSGDPPVQAFLERMPRLEEFHDSARSVDLGWLFARPMPHLRRLTVYCGWQVYPLEKLAANASLRDLTHLFCWPRGQWNDGDGRPYLTREGIEAVVRSPHLPSLQHLQLCLTELGDDGMRMLVESGVFGRLKTLDLHGGTVTDAGARVLAACPDLRRLEWLRLSQNYLTRAGVAAIRAAGVKLHADLQFGEADREQHIHLNDGDDE